MTAASHSSPSTIQENIFGEDQKFTDMNQTHLDEEQLGGEAPAEETKSDESLEEHKKSEFDCRRYRQFAVTVYLDIRNVLGHLVKVRGSARQTDLGIYNIFL